MNTATTLTGGKHGTKIAGGLIIASSVLSSIDPSTLPPAWLPYFTGFLGALAFARGFINTKNAQPPQS